MPWVIPALQSPHISHHGAPVQVCKDVLDSTPHPVVIKRVKSCLRVATKAMEEADEKDTDDTAVEEKHALLSEDAFVLNLCGTQGGLRNKRFADVDTMGLFEALGTVAFPPFRVIDLRFNNIENAGAKGIALYLKVCNALSFVVWGLCVASCSVGALPELTEPPSPQPAG